MARSHWSPPSRPLSDQEQAAQERRREASRARGQHPDLDDSGALRADAYLPPAQRDFERMYADPAQREHFMTNLAAWQGSLPEDVQQAVGGQTHAGSPYEGYQRYREHVDEVMRWGHACELTGADVARLSDSEYDALFDQRGQLRPERKAEGWTFRPTRRDVSVGDTIDPYTRRELRR